jgi:TPR repeat protein
MLDGKQTLSDRSPGVSLPPMTRVVKRSLVLMIVLTAGLSGCVSVKSFLDSTNIIHLKPALSAGEAYSKGRTAEAQHRYPEAVDYYQIAARHGDIKAELRLARLYRDGRDGVTRDLAASASWYLKAAEQGEVSAQYESGENYFYGRGVKKDYYQALRWYESAARRGHGAGRVRLAAMYYGGVGVGKDLRAAFKWYEAAATSGDASAKAMLGHMYLRGEGVTKNVAEAVKWLGSAATDPVWADRSADENPSNQARLELAAVYENGDGVRKDAIKAFGLIKDASDHGSIRGKVELARHYTEGIGVVKDFPAAIQLLSEVPKNSKYNDSSAITVAVHNAVKMGEKSYKEKRYKEALRNLEAAANYGDARAQGLLGDMYFAGAGAPKNHTLAVEWWGKAARQDDLDAITSLGISYWIGVGSIAKQRDQAIKYLLYAAKEGNKHATYTLETLVFPRWHFVTASREHIGLVRRGYMERHGGEVRFMVMSVSAPASLRSDYRFSSYSKILYQTDCTDKTMGPRSGADYTSGGKITKSYQYSPVDMRPIVAGSAEEDYFEYVCSRARGKL